MKFLSSIKSGEREKPALIFLLKLLILLCLLKCIFFFYNKGITGGWDISSWANATQIILWSLLYDSLFLSLINLPFFLLLLLKPFRRNNVLLTLMAAVFALLNSFCILLNIIDIFYYRFHQQRADADLIYVLKNPFKNNDWGSAIIGILVIALLVIITLLIFKFFCPSTLIARKYSNSTKDNFDIYLPNWLAKYTKLIYTAILIIILIITIYQILN